MMNVIDKMFADAEFATDVREAVAVYSEYMAFCNKVSGKDNAVELKNIAYGKVTQSIATEYPQYDVDYLVAVVRRVYNMQSLVKSMECLAPTNRLYQQLARLFDKEYALALLYVKGLGYDEAVLESLY